MSDFWVGPQNVPDTYRLVSLLGGGAEGEVWQAELPLPEGGRRSVAVKITAANEDAFGGVQWEQFGHLLRSLSHPGLVRVTDVFAGPAMHRAGEERAGSFRYVVMDFIEGVNLREWIAENPDITASQRLRVLGMVAAALDEMHAGGTTEIAVAHGDVKPANIVVSADRGTVLVDLGMARLTDTGGRPGRSAPYAAPELRLPGALATPESDRYAFAVTAAQVLTGEPPPVGNDGWLDPGALRAQLARNPLTARKHVLVRHLVDAIEAPINARPRRLRPWLDGAVETLTQVTNSSLPAVDSAPQATAIAHTAVASKPLEQTQVPPRFGPTQRAALPPLLTAPAPPPGRSPSRPPPMPAVAPAPRPVGDKDRRRLLVAGIAAVAIALVSGIGLAAYLTLAGPPELPNVFREPIQTAGVDAYMPPAGKDVSDVKSPLQLHGNQPGGLPRLYGGIRNNAECDRAAIASFLVANPDRGTEWARALGIQPLDVPSFVAQLTPVILVSDTSVTTHAFDGGHAVARQAVLQTGAAVLIDPTGVPRARCYTGNPAGFPTPPAYAVYGGPDWQYFDEDSVVSVQPHPERINEFALVDVRTGETMIRPTGTAGEADHSPQESAPPPPVAAVPTPAIAPAPQSSGTTGSAQTRSDGQRQATLDAQDKKAKKSQQADPTDSNSSSGATTGSSSDSSSSSGDSSGGGSSSSSGDSSGSTSDSSSSSSGGKKKSSGSSGN